MLTAIPTTSTSLKIEGNPRVSVALPANMKADSTGTLEDLEVAVMLPALTAKVSLSGLDVSVTIAVPTLPSTLVVICIPDTIDGMVVSKMMLGRVAIFRKLDVALSESSVSSNTDFTNEAKAPIAASVRLSAPNPDIDCCMGVVS